MSDHFDRVKRIQQVRDEADLGVRVHSQRSRVDRVKGWLWQWLYGRWMCARWRRTGRTPWYVRHKLGGEPTCVPWEIRRAWDERAWERHMNTRDRSKA